MAIYEDETWDQIKDPEVIKKAKAETLAKNARITKKREEEVEELKKLFKNSTEDEKDGTEIS